MLAQRGPHCHASPPHFSSEGSVTKTREPSPSCCLRRPLGYAVPVVVSRPRYTHLLLYVRPCPRCKLVLVRSRRPMGWAQAITPGSMAPLERRCDTAHSPGPASFAWCSIGSLRRASGQWSRLVCGRCEAQPACPVWWCARGERSRTAGAQRRPSAMAMPPRPPRALPAGRSPAPHQQLESGIQEEEQRRSPLE